MSLKPVEPSERGEFRTGTSKVTEDDGFSIIIECGNHQEKGLSPQLFAQLRL